MPRTSARARSSNLSYEIYAPKKAIDRIRAQSEQDRTAYVIGAITQFFGDGIRSNPDAFRDRFRKMAATPFNFFRGSAILFYQDLKVDQDPYVQKNLAAGNIFIHGDLHAQNFGTYLDSNGILNFDVNDFDESYIGPFTWDVKRLLASLNLICYAKGFSDDEIERVLRTCVDAYVRQVERFCQQTQAQFSLTLDNTTGCIKKLLNETRVRSHVALLDKLTCIENYDRRFIRSKHVQSVDKVLYNQLVGAFQQYLESIPEYKRIASRGSTEREMTYHIKDVVQCTSSGIGSAGTVNYSFLIEGPSETLENDIVLFMKPAQKSAVSYVVHNPQLDAYFQHDGLRTVLCSYAMQASTPRWLGFTTFNSVSCLVDSVTAHAEGLEWTNINDLASVLEVVEYLGRATAKIHCVADSDCVHMPQDVVQLPFSLIPRDVEQTIQSTLQGQEDQFVQDMVEFGMVYGELVRRDHNLFFEALRNHRIAGL